MIPLQRLNDSIYSIKEKLTDGEFKAISDHMMEVYNYRGAEERSSGKGVIVLLLIILFVANVVAYNRCK